MTASIRTVALALIVAALAGPVLAQTSAPAQSRSFAPGAAATLPNSFDGPRAAPTAPTPLPAAPAGQVSDVQMAEAALRSIIGQLQAGDIDESLFTPDAGQRLNSQLGAVTPMIKAYGELLSIEPRSGADQVGQFLVTFENAATQWRIGLEEGGLVAAVLFREAPAESSEAETAPES